MTKKKTILIVAILLVVVGIVSLVVGLLMGGSLNYTFDFANGLQSSTSSSKLESVSQVSIDSDITNINITTNSTGINISSIDETDIVIMSGSSYSFEYLCNSELYVFDYSVEGNSLDIDIVCNASGISVSIFGFGSTCRDKLIITVPQQQILDTITISGDVVDVDISNIVCPTVDIAVDVGEVELSNCTVSTQLSVACDIGDIDIEKCIVDSITVQTDVGDIGMNSSTIGTAKITAEVGNVEVELCTLQNANVTVDVGNIEIELPNGSVKYAVDADADTGNISIGNGIIEGIDSSCNQLTLAVDIGNIEVSID